VLVVVGIVCSAATQANAQTYEAATQRAVELARAKQYPQAAETLESIADEFPQDFELVLRLARLNFKAERYVRAQHYYAAALALAGASKAAQIGLAWTLLRRGQREQARAQFRRVLDRWPGTAAAERGLRQCQPQPAVVLVPSTSLTAYAYRDHAFKDGSLGMTVRLPLWIKNRVLLGLAYRGSHCWTVDRFETGRVKNFDQHEGYLTAGLVWPDFGLRASYALVSDGTGYWTLIHAVGLTGRYSALFGDLRLSANITFYSDMDVVRVGPSWTLPLTSWLSVVPALRLQYAVANGQSLQLLGKERATLASGSLSVHLRNRIGALWLGATYGDQVRPANLDLNLVFDSTDRVVLSTWIGASLNLANSWTPLLALSLVQLESPIDRTNGISSTMQGVTVGVSRRW